MAYSRNGVVWPEPAPNWPKAKLVWQVGWPLHVYSFASLNLLVALYALYLFVVKLRNAHRKPHSVFINLMLAFFGSSRAAILFWDPYASNEYGSRTELVVCVILYALGTAFLTSALSLLLLLLLDLTRISLASSKVQNLKFLLGVMTFNVGYILVADIIVAHAPQARDLILICQVGFALWGIAVSVGYVVAARRLWRNSGSSREAALYNRQMVEEAKKIRQLVRLMYLASFCAFIKFFVVIYVAISECVTFAREGELDSWTWFALQTVLRATELISCCFVFVIALRAKKNQNQANQVTDTEMKPRDTERRIVHEGEGVA